MQGVRLQEQSIRAIACACIESSPDGASLLRQNKWNCFELGAFYQNLHRARPRNCHQWPRPRGFLQDEFDIESSRVLIYCSMGKRLNYGHAN